MTALVTARWWCQRCQRWGHPFVVAESRCTVAVADRLDEHRTAGCRGCAR